MIKNSGIRHPTDVVYFPTADKEGETWHPTQKPVELGRYLVRTYTDPGDVVLDNAFGSGSFLVAASLEGRRYIGVEKNEGAKYQGNPVDLIAVARKRLARIDPDRWYTVKDDSEPQQKMLWKTE